MGQEWHFTECSTTQTVTQRSDFQQFSTLSVCISVWCGLKFQIGNQIVWKYIFFAYNDIGLRENWEKVVFNTYVCVSSSNRMLTEISSCIAITKISYIASIDGSPMNCFKSARSINARSIVDVKFDVVNTNIFGYVRNWSS